MNKAPKATYDQDLLLTAGDALVGGQLTSFDPDPGDSAFYSLVGGPIPGLVLQEDGRWTFDPDDPAYQALAPEKQRTITVAYRVDDRVAPIQASLPSGVIRVGGTGASFTSIQAALDAAPAGATIYVAAGTYNENLTISKSVTLFGANHGIGASKARGAETVIRGFVLATAAAATVTLDGVNLVGSSGGVNLRVEASSSRLVNSIITSTEPAGGFADFAFVRYKPDPTNTIPFSSVVIEDNLFDGILDLVAMPVVVQINRADNASVQRNTFSNTGGGGSVVLAENIGTAKVANNIFIGGGKGLATYNGTFANLEIIDNTVLDTNYSGIDINSGSNVLGGNLSGNIVTGSGVDPTGKGEELGLTYANLAVSPTAVIAPAFTVGGNDFSNPSGRNKEVIGIVPRGATDQVVRDSSIATFTLSVEGGREPIVDQILPLARPVDAARFNVTPFATGLPFPKSMVELPDGSLLVAGALGDPTRSNLFSSPSSQLIRLVDADGDGRSDSRQILADAMPGLVTSLSRVGNLLIALSDQTANSNITFWRLGEAPSDPAQFVGRLNLAFPSGFSHRSFAIAARRSPHDLSKIELYFNLGSKANAVATSPTETIVVTAGAGTTYSGTTGLQADTVYRVMLQDQGNRIDIAPAQLIARGLRNAAGFTFNTDGSLYLQDNGFSDDANGNPETSISADELNRIASAELGVRVPDFGFPLTYTSYSSGTIVNPSPLVDQPLISYTPVNGRKSEGIAEITLAPVGFPSEFLGDVFGGFHGKFVQGKLANDENPLVVADPVTGNHFHFLNNQIMGHPDGLLSVANALYVADLNVNGDIGGISSTGLRADQNGAIYRISPITASNFLSVPVVNGVTSREASITWVTDSDAITSLELWGGALIADAPRTTTLLPKSSGAAFTASVNLDGLDSATTYGYRVRVGRSQAEGTFRTAEGPLPRLLSTLAFGTATSDIGYAVATATDGSILLGGETEGGWDGRINAGRTDGFLVKLDAEGRRLWTTWYGSNQVDPLRKISVASDGTIAVVGGTLGNLDGHLSSGSSDGYVGKIGADGTKLWTRLIGGTSWDYGHGVATGPDGSVYAVGYSASPTLDGQTKTGIAPGPDLFLTRFDTNGNRLWTRRWGNGVQDYGMNVVVAADGSVYITGFTQKQVNGTFDYDALLSRYDANGNRLWTQILATPRDDFGEDLAITADGSIIVAVSSDGDFGGYANSGGRDVGLAAFRPDGTRMWTRLIGSAGTEEARSLITGDDGSLTMTGRTTGNLGGQTNSGGDDGFVTRFSAAGQVLWTRLMGSGGNDVGWGLANLPGGDLAVVGEVDGSLPGSSGVGGRDAFVQRLGTGDSELLVTPDGQTIRFDPLRYIASNPDLISAFGAHAAAGRWHYITWGFNEGRRIDAFDPAQYLAGNDALIARFGSDTAAATRHYISEGFATGTPADAFDENRYLASNPGLIPTYRSRPADAAQHYLSTGRFNGSSRTAFDPLRYIASHPDLINAFGASATSGSWHYVNWGSTEGRRIDAFDPAQYLAGNDALIARFGSDTAAATRHYINEGFAAGTPADAFDEFRYLASNPDLITNYRSRPAEAAQQYLSTGRFNGSSRNAFDPLQYIASYPDLIQAFGVNAFAGSWHYVLWGSSEGRLSDRFDEVGYLATHPELIGSDPSALAAHFISTSAASLA